MPVEVWLRPEAGNMVSASRKSVRVIAHAGRRVGVVHFWHFLAGEMATILREALAGPFADCDALVIDVRGRGGNPVGKWTHCIDVAMERRDPTRMP